MKAASSIVYGSLDLPTLWSFDKTWLPADVGPQGTLHVTVAQAVDEGVQHGGTTVRITAVAVSLWAMWEDNECPVERGRHRQTRPLVEAAFRFPPAAGILSTAVEMPTEGVMRAGRPLRTPPRCREGV